MAKNDDKTGDAQVEQPNMAAQFIAALKSLPPAELSSILSAAGIVPTTMGMTPETLQVIMGSMTQVSANALKESLRSQRKENPNYPEKSVFHPAGRFTDDGTPKPAKVRFRRRTYHNHILLGGELETEQEIKLFNAITDDRTARDGKWKAEILEKGTARERIMVTTPSMTPDERSDNSLPLPMILMELIGGPMAVNADTMANRILELEAKMKELTGSAA